MSYKNDPRGWKPNKDKEKGPAHASTGNPRQRRPLLKKGWRKGGEMFHPEVNQDE